MKKKIFIWLGIIILAILLFFPMFYCQKISWFNDVGDPSKGISGYSTVCRSLLSIILHGPGREMIQ